MTRRAPSGRHGQGHPQATRAALAEVIGHPLSDARLAGAVLDGRGHLFQRLEWLGDSVLDLLVGLAVLRHGGPGTASAARLVADATLAVTAREAGLVDLLDWDPSDDRCADLVEAAVGAAFTDGGWEAAVAVAQRLVLDRLPLGAVLTAHRFDGTDPEGPSRRELAAVGSHVVEAAVAVHLAAAMPHADEGELTDARQRRHTVVRLAALAVTAGLAAEDVAPAVASDLLEVHLAGVAALGGPAAAVDRARALGVVPGPAVPG